MSGRCVALVTSPPRQGVRAVQEAQLRPHDRGGTWARLGLALAHVVTEPAQLAPAAIVGGAHLDWTSAAYVVVHRDGGRRIVDRDEWFRLAHREFERRDRRRGRR